jgi:transcriptional regulator with PAS, ATPase and Fis domain
MMSSDLLLQQINKPLQSYKEQVLLRCALAKSLEDSGNYEAAAGAMGDLWPRVGGRPELKNLDDLTAAEVLLRIGVLTGWLGSIRQLPMAQEMAKDLITEGLSLYESLGQHLKIAESQIEIAYCYIREGALNEAQIILQTALSILGSTTSDLSSKAVLRLAIVESLSGRYNNSFQILSEHASLFGKINNHTIKGSFYNELGRALRNLGTAEKREDYLDRALVEYEAASFHFELAGHVGYQASVENNIGFLLHTLDRFDEAHKHLDRARRLFIKLKDSRSAAQVNETRARAFLAQGRHSEAERAAKSAVLTFEKGDHKALLAEALTTHGIALARLNQIEPSRRSLERAVEVAENVGDYEGAGRAALSIIEELDNYLRHDELIENYERADQLLINSQHLESIARLRKCARRLVTAANQNSKTSIPVPDIILASKNMARVLNEAQRVAKTNSTVLITGETGTGKELLARMIHDWSNRHGKLVAINCASLSDTLIESQLFGHKKGSFTDAVDNYSGAVREAIHGTLFLDEIGELSEPNQAKLLRLVEYGEVLTIGSSQPEYVNIRIVAATNRNLKKAVKTGRFREDLYYRLSTFTINIPPLRERVEDIPELARYFINESETRYGKHVHFTPESLEAMKHLKLYGNVRELRSLIERAVLTAESDVITAESIETLVMRQTDSGDPVNPWRGCNLSEEIKRYEGELIKNALKECRGSITRAAKLLGLSHQALAYILNSRQKDLLPVRTDVKKRNRSIVQMAKSK